MLTKADFTFVVLGHTHSPTSAKPARSRKHGWKAWGWSWKGPSVQFPTWFSYPGFWEESEILLYLQQQSVIPLPSLWLESCHFVSGHIDFRERPAAFLCALGSHSRRAREGAAGTLNTGYGRAVCPSVAAVTQAGQTRK